ncbi:30S ribosomal protein S1, chloroplastic [Apostasia shenzhenica]|uniref:30S ribosomal protein S1, chloroplastic n=1 Tax=Apostasia shenzhenica TaxID=1088818 RepID=A0A2I0A5Y2_9ASPA|nr:30S ribosomal protein S1, chloroplastic [Apostasia shenzhenica]
MPSSSAILAFSSFSFSPLILDLQTHSFILRLKSTTSRSENAVLFPSSCTLFRPPYSSVFQHPPRNPRVTHVPFSSPFESSNPAPELGLLGKPSPVRIPKEEEPPDSSKTIDLDEALAPFLKFFKEKDSDEKDQFGEDSQAILGREGMVKARREKLDDGKLITIEYYEPKPGDLVVGVVVSGNENKLDVSVGADMLGTMLTKEVLPLYDEELAYLCCDLGEESEEFMRRGKMGLVKDEEAMGGGKVPGRPVVEEGAVVFAEVLGRTLSGRPLLSSRRMFRRVAWRRLRQIKQLNEPFEVKIFEWNTGGLLTRIEGLRAFLPKAELMSKVGSFMDLKANVGRRMFVCISRVDEATNDLIISEREAWSMLHLKEGTLLEGMIRKILPFGAQVQIEETNRSGLLHISNITRSRVTTVSDVLEVDEKVKVLVVKSLFPEKISLSIAELESQPGLFLTDKKRVFSEAEEMAKRYRKRMPVFSAVSDDSGVLPVDVLPFDDEAKLYANWEWLKFEHEDESRGSAVSGC